MPGPPAAAEVPRSLADDLRARSDAELAELLRARPDLLGPVPSDLGALVSRATTAASVSRALDRLDRFVLQTADVLVALPEDPTVDAVAAWLGADPARPLAELRRAALVWGPPGAPRLVRAVRQVLGQPAGLGPPLREALAAYAPRRVEQLARDLGLASDGDLAATTRCVAEHLTDPAVLSRLLAGAPADACEVLARLIWGPPQGRIGNASRDVATATARSPVEWLLARGLLVATDLTTVVLPREVAVHLRGGRVHARTEPAPPEPTGRARDAGLVDRTAAGAAVTAVRHVEDVLGAWGTGGPAVLRAGGLGVRELRRVAQLLDVDERHAALVVETAYAAGLLAASDDVDQVWLPTPAYDLWLDREPAQRWAALVTAWLEGSRVAGLVGARDERDRVASALGPDLDRSVAPELRRAVLDELAALPPATVPHAGTVEARTAWRRPRRGGRLHGDLVAWTLAEAELLGVTGLGALATAGRALLAGGDPAAAVAGLLPRPLDHVLLQADLTAVAPGPLESTLAAELSLVADVESRGGATVYRFTESSVRRALDAGRSASDLHDLLAERSRTPVPQPLAYLLDDAARRHGRIRVGTARAYLRCDDETLLSQIVADRRSAELRLRRLAPTVVTAQAPVDAVLDRLRAMGYAPAAESADGAVVVRRADVRRSPARQRPPRLAPELPEPGETLLGVAVRALRAGDRASQVERRPADSPPAGTPPRSPLAQTLTTLREAATSGTPLWIGYVDTEGQASQRVIDPLSVTGGYVSAFDHLREEVRTFAVHRITGVAALAEA